MTSKYCLGTKKCGTGHVCKQETTKLWNLKNLLTPASWFAYFITIISVVVSLKLCCYIGKKLGLLMVTKEIALVPFRFILHQNNLLPSLGPSDLSGLSLLSHGNSW